MLKQEPYVMNEKQKQYIQDEAKVCAPNYKPLPVVLDRGSGVWLYDIDGNKYIDMMSAYSAVSHGHCHPELVQTISNQAQKLSVCSRAFHATPLKPYMEKLVELSGLDLVLPMNTGAEAVETAIKTARRWGYRQKNIPEDKGEIIVCANNFHGRTTTIISFSSDVGYKSGFGPLTPGFVTIPFGDEKALEKAITPNTCAFLVEPIQGEAGIIVPPKGYLANVKKICAQNNVLFILDEVQSGLCRTGKMFAFEHEDARPDGLILGKALGGGMLPVSAFVARKEVLSVMTPGSHGSTFGGNPLAATVGLKALEIMVRDNYAKRSQSLGEHMIKRLKDIKSPYIKDIRGKGLWVALEIDPDKASARLVCEKLLQAGLLSKETHDTVVRLAPPLTIEKEELDYAIDIIAHTLSQMGE